MDESVCEIVDALFRAGMTTESNSEDLQVTLKKPKFNLSMSGEQGKT
jgi:hypothetical protein